MTVDLVIATYNRGSVLMETVENVLTIIDDLNHIYIIDNASTDNTKELLATVKHPKITVIRNDKNLGATGGKNIGMRLSGADIVAVIDDDAVFFTNNPIENIKQIFAQDATLGIIQFKIVNFTQKKILAYEFPGKDIETNGDREFYTGYFVGAGHAIRKSTLNKIGYYQEDFFIYYEEIELSYRAINNGYAIKYCPSVGVLHKKDPRGRQKASSMYRKNLRNRLVMTRAYLPLKYALINNSLWFIKTIIDSRSIVTPILACLDYFRDRKNIKRDPLSKKAIEYLKAHYGRLYK